MSVAPGQAIAPPKQTSSVNTEDEITQSMQTDNLPSKSIDKESLQKALDKEAAKRKPHTSAHRGWKEVSGWEEQDVLTPDDEVTDMLSRATWIDDYLPDKFYGDWYHTVAILILASFLCWVVGKFKLSVGPVFLITVPAALYYRSSIRKYRSLLRLDAQREFSVHQIESDFESMDWLNTFLDKFWILLEPSISQIVCEQANPILAASPAPAFVKQLWLDTFTMGTKPPRIDKVKTLSRSADDVVVMDWVVSMTPNTLADATVKQLKNKVNQTVIVKAKLFGITFPVVVSDLAFKVNVRVRFRMMTKFPHIKTINVSLVEPPQFDFVAKPFGGNSIFASEVLSFPGLYPFINEMVKKFVGPIVFDPLSFQLNVEQLLAGNAFGSAVGILEVTAKSATGLKGVDTFENTVDPYLTFGFGNTVLGKTKTIDDTYTPVWNEKVNVMLKTVSDPLWIMCYDENDGKKDKLIGAVLYDMEDLMDKNTLKNVKLPLLRNNKPAGELTVDLKFMPALQGATLPDGSYDAPPDLNTGVARFEITEARAFSEDDAKPLSTFVELYLNDELKATSSVVKKTANPTFSAVHEDIITDRSKAKVRVILRDDKKKLVGSRTLRLSDIIDATVVDQPWFPMTKGKGEIKLSGVWSSVAMTGVDGSIGYTEPIGVVRVYIKKATDLRNLDTFGDMDPYVRVLVNSIPKARTPVIENTTNAVYENALWIPVSSPNQRLKIEAMDFEKNQQDRTLGSFDVRLNDFIEKSESGDYIETVGELKESRLISKKGPKGTITYSLAFYPTIPTRSQEEILEEAAIREKKAAAAESESDPKAKKQESSEEDDLDADIYGHKIILPIEKVTDYQQGVFVFSVFDGKFSSSGHVQAFFDDRGYADYVSPVVSAGQSRIATTGDFLVKELDYSTVTFRLTGKPDNHIKKEAYAEVTVPTLQLLRRSYEKPVLLDLSNSNTLRVQCRWIPVNMKELPALDSILNSGELKVRILSASGIPAGDSNGKSDPFIKAYINGEEVHKTKTIKKTLTPVWTNEEFSITLSSRVTSTLRLKCNDWDIGIEQDDKLCEATISLQDIDPVTKSWVEKEIPLFDDDKNPAGSAIIEYQFEPHYVLKLTENSAGINLISGPKAVGAAGTMIIGAGGKVLGTGVGAGAKVLGGATSLFKKKK
ncbi:unnamed protein product [Kuraishia capsulata CBS 1993]|uniref:Tricalbin n=1 Tax=Kuraishia capsulata CBS 1993 TaxID=1382522 RepID=W6MFI1_9ASCO|nr:uncharacterized protein KUCA_T00000307001 [Kuraishia capsulata CBS 1993]CDK24346.1 unnamed protein product [Kuraishia capsulata CBS 1993]